jgi:hypothetical protein
MRPRVVWGAACYQLSKEDAPGSGRPLTPILELLMTTSPETAWMNHPAIRALVEQAGALALEERITLVKGLIPGIADALSEEEYEQFVTFIRLKGERYHEAKTHPGEGRAGRHVPGERELEGR